MVANRIHEVRCLHEFFVAVIERRKTFDVRKNDRGYTEGDGLLLVEMWKNGRLTGRAVYCQITYVLAGGADGITADHCVLGIRPGFLNRREIMHGESD